jgi:hypothetical protein
LFHSENWTNWALFEELTDSLCHEKWFHLTFLKTAASSGRVSSSQHQSLTSSDSQTALSDQNCWLWPQKCPHVSLCKYRQKECSTCVRVTG